MRYEPSDTMRNHEPLKNEWLNDESLDGLPDELAELALQLDSDADRLAEIYPARLPGAEEVRARPAAVARGFWPSIGRVASVSRVAAAVCIVAGLAIAISGPSMWRAMFGSPPGGPLVDSQGGPDRSLADVHIYRPPAMQPVLISTEAMRQFSGEETEILADAIPHGESGVVIADL